MSTSKRPRNLVHLLRDRVAVALARDEHLVGAGVLAARGPRAADDQGVAAVIEGARTLLRADESDEPPTDGGDDLG